jgi:hypothetical protein
MDSRKKHCEEDCDVIWQPESNLTMLKGTTPTTASITIPTTGTATATTLNSLSINTSCFSKQLIRLEFAGNIIFPATQFDATLNFQIFRQYNNQIITTAIGSPWVFARQLAVAVGTGESVSLATKDTFSFFVYDTAYTGSTQDGATYTLVVTPSISTVAGTVTINNATLGVIVGGNRR